jgi:hypothetical protein
VSGRYPEIAQQPGQHFGRDGRIGGGAVSRATEICPGAVVKPAR